MREIFIRETFSGKTVLITGATGFLGKVLVEKLLRDCDVKKIFIFLRRKKSENSQERFEKYKNLSVFENIKNLNCLHKLVPVEADFGEDEKFGISDKVLEVLKDQTNFIFHCAATVKFDEALEDAIKTNLIGTQRLFDLAENFKNLEVFVHISTAYSNINRKFIHEKIYEPVYNYKEVIKLVEDCNADELRHLTEFALSTFPNTYVFSKHLTEQLVSDRSESIPTVILRPSIVCPSFSEPFEGWIDNFNGIMGILPAAAGTGLLRTGYGRSDSKLDIIPCDFAVNSMIAACASMASNDNKHLRIFNCTTSSQQPMTWGQFLDLNKLYYKYCPSMKVLWFPSGGLTSSFTIYMIKFVLFQLIPAYVIDLISFIIGERTWAVKLQLRIFSSMKVFEHFLNNSWEWKNSNFVLLQKLISPGEKNVFNFDVENFDYDQYMRNWLIGTRRYLLKQSDETIPAAKRKYRLLYFLDFSIKILFWFLICKFIYNKI